MVRPSGNPRSPTGLVPEVEFALDKSRRQIQHEPPTTRPPKRVRLNAQDSADRVCLVLAQVSKEDCLRVSLGCFHERPVLAAQQLLEPTTLLESQVVEAVLSVDVGDAVGEEHVVRFKWHHPGASREVKLGYRTGLNMHGGVIRHMRPGELAEQFGDSGADAPSQIPEPVHTVPLPSATPDAPPRQLQLF